MLKDRAGIVGIGQTQFAKRIPENALEMACVAISNALVDAGIAASEVDGLVSFTGEAGAEVEIARTLGFGDITFFAQTGYGGGAGCATIGHAAMAVATGRAKVVVAWRSRKRGGTERRPWAATGPHVSGPKAWSHPFGMIRPVDEIATLARRHMHQYGTTRDHLAAVALAIRGHANRNPAALMFDRPLTAEEYFESRWVSEPLCLLDNCLETDGAVACVITSIQRARDTPNPVVSIHAAAQGLPQQHETMSNFYCADPLSGPGWVCARALWENADVGPRDVDVAQFYDAFSPLVILTLEAYGFCKPGEGGPFVVDEGITWPDSRLPTNTSGGSLSEAYVHGFNLIAEGVRQIRGTSSAQVPDAEVSLVTSGEGVPTSAVLLVRR